MKTLKYLLAALGLGLASPSIAIASDCYHIAKILPNYEKQFESVSAGHDSDRFKPKREFFWILDETTPFSREMFKDMYELSKKQLAPGDAIYIASFSYNGKDNGVSRFLKPLFEYKLDLPIDEKKDAKLSTLIGHEDLRKYDQCLANQKGYVEKKIGLYAKGVMDGYSPTISKSEILYSLKEISVRVNQSKAKERVILLSSDMLENSAVTSFYKNNIPKKINPQSEWANADVKSMIGDFGGAKVYVYGAGIVGSDVNTKDGAISRDPQTIMALQAFWTQYFKASNATLIAFGHPTPTITPAP
jgi:hypothetical protein